MLVEHIARAVEAAPDVLGGTEDELALLFGEVRAAAREEAPGEDRRDREPYL
jgi:hypothetical protein